MQHIARAKRERGAKLVVVDPYRTGTAEKAHMHLDAATRAPTVRLACGIMHTLFAEGFADREYLARYTDVPDELEAHLQTRTPAVGGADIRCAGAADHRLRATLWRHPAIFPTHGLRHCRDRETALPMCTPSVACRPLPAPGVTRAAERFTVTAPSTTSIRRPSWAWMCSDKNVRVLDQSRIGPVLCGDPDDLQERSTGNGPVHSEYQPHGSGTAIIAACAKGFSRSDLFVCVHEQFMTETAAMADIVLPATTFLEHDDIYKAGGHTYLQVTRKVIEPLCINAGPTTGCLCELAKRLGARASRVSR